MVSVATSDESCVISHFEKLSPCPESKIIAVTLPGFFEVLRRLPVVVFPKLLFVGYAFTCRQKTVHFINGVAFYFERLTDVPSHWEGRVQTFSPLVRSKNLAPNGIVNARDDFCDQS